MEIGRRKFQEGHTYIMGILNVTPDSFSDGGELSSLDAVLKRAEQMIKDGADILDVGGESTRPGAIPVEENEEMERVLPVLEALCSRFDAPVSLDTCKSAVAEEGILAGASLINDIWGLRQDAHMAEVIARHGAACCLVHNRSKAEYKDFLQDVLGDLRESISLAGTAGIAKEKILLDPGIGFAKSYEQNLYLLNHLDALCGLGLPMLLGASRKSVIGETLGLPVHQREEGTLVTTVLAAQCGYRFVRVHDVKKAYRAIRMTEAITKSK